MKPSSDFKIGTFNLYNLALPNIVFHHHLAIKKLQALKPEMTK